MAQDDLLTFDYPGLASRTESLFDALRESDSLSERFISDPAGVLTERVLSLPEPLSGSEIENTNRFLFSLLSNPEFMRWAEEWQGSRAREISTTGEGEGSRVEVRVDQEELYRELAEAIVKFGAADEIEVPSGGEESVSAAEVPEGLILEDSHFKVPHPKPVNFNVAVNATVGVSLVGAAAAVVVVVVVIPVVVIGLLESERIDREDLRRVAAGLDRELRDRAVRLRDEGELGPGTSVA